MNKIKIEANKEALDKLTKEEIEQSIKEKQQSISFIEAYLDGLRQEIQIYKDLLENKE